MRYNVSGLLKGPTGSERLVEVDASVDLGDPEVEAVGPVSGWLHLIRDHAGVLVTGSLAAQVRVACSRCLEPVILQLDVELEESFRPTVAIPGGPPAVREDEWEAATLIDERNVLDVGEVLRQAMLLAVPLQVLCRTDCAGLCPMCGADRNVEPCDCHPEPDPRWAALRSMLDPDGAE